MTIRDQVIAHWRRMRDDAPACDENKETPHGDSCLYCELWRLEDDGSNCIHCPISKAAGIIQCKFETYLEATEAWCDYRNSGWDSDFEAWWHVKADAMIKFLEGLPDNG